MSVFGNAVRRADGGVLRHEDDHILYEPTSDYVHRVVVESIVDGEGYKILTCNGAPYIIIYIDPIGCCYRPALPVENKMGVAKVAVRYNRVSYRVSCTDKEDGEYDRYSNPNGRKYTIDELVEDAKSFKRQIDKSLIRKKYI